MEFLGHTQENKSCLFLNLAFNATRGKLIGEKSVIDLCENKIHVFKRKYRNKLKKLPLLINLLEFGMRRVS